MQQRSRYVIISILLLMLPFIVEGQQKTIVIKGSVKEKNTKKPISGANVQILGGQSIQTDVFGEFKVAAKIGDEIRISHESFRTVYHTIKDNQKIEVLVADKILNASSRTISAEYGQMYDEYVKKAQKTSTKDAATSIDYLTKALESIQNDDPRGATRKATVYEKLADVYKYWNESDFAEENYKISLTYREGIPIRIKLGKAQLDNNKFREARATFRDMLQKGLSVVQKIVVWDGLGDSYRGLQDRKSALDAYTNALEIAKRNDQEDILIELNSKIADILEAQGNMRSAESYLDNSVRLASGKSKKTAARQRSKVADFYAKNNRYDKEIALRKEALEDIEELESGPEKRKEKAMDTTIAHEETERELTSQVQNYKIANAFVAQQAFDEAIPYLNESIEKASSENDLVVQKDATRKLGEVYRTKGELKKASEAFEEYEVIVDKLYVQKEQEISQAALFRKQLAERARRIATLEKDRELSQSKYQLVVASQELANQQSLRQQILIYSLIAFSILLLFVAYLMYRNIRQQQYANNLLALKSLRSQMNPHFIFNALNSVNTFIATSDERTANRYLTDFSMLMRAVLENSEEDFIPLEKEIELLELYVKLEHFRFQDKFDYEIQVDPEIAIASFMIPPMLLQPYVENAVWHGLRYMENKGFLTITFKRLDEQSIEIIIRDNGIGRDRSKALKTEHQKKQQSKGMHNIKKRITILNSMYKDKILVDVNDLQHTGEGTEVKVIIKKE